MPTEIERKFLVVDDRWRASARSSEFLRQGYLPNAPGATVRVRRAGPFAFLTVKGEGIVARPEFEYPIPIGDAEALLASLCRPPLIEKTRHDVWHDGLVWHVDEFHSGNQGLVLAEVELQAVDQAVSLPLWVGREVTGDPAYRNSKLGWLPLENRSAAIRVEHAPKS